MQILNTGFYNELAQLPHNERNDPALVRLQVKFVKEHGANVKGLIRLVKFWRKKCIPIGRNYPSSYPFELLTIYAWEQAGTPRTFNTTQGFRQVLMYLAHYTSINVMWTANYTSDQIDRSLLRDR